MNGFGVFTAAGVAFAAGLIMFASAGAQPQSPAAPSAPERRAEVDAPRAAPAGAPNQMGQILVEGLKSTPGCLGVESGAMSSGKQVICAFFENKQAAMNWYNHPVHQRMRSMMPVSNPDHVPMKHVPDGVPLMVVASISFDGQPAIKDSPIPFSQIGIEIFAPVTGGLNVNGGFAPESFRKLIKEPE